jgi:hypothetical protein
MTIDITFLDSGREPTQKPNPKYPTGMDVNCAKPGEKSCTFNLPYPAPRCGSYVAKCQTCGFTAAVTVAGRADDPRTLTVPCKAPVH